MKVYTENTQIQPNHVYDSSLFNVEIRNRDGDVLSVFQVNGLIEIHFKDLVSYEINRAGTHVIYVENNIPESEGES